MMSKVKVNETGGVPAQRKVMNETDLSLLNLLGPKKDNMLANSISGAIPYHRNSSIDQPRNQALSTENVTQSIKTESKDVNASAPAQVEEKVTAKQSNIPKDMTHARLQPSSKHV